MLAVAAQASETTACQTGSSADELEVQCVMDITPRLRVSKQSRPFDWLRSW